MATRSPYRKPPSAATTPPHADALVLSVSQLNQRIEQIVECQPNLQDLQVRGEISNFNHHARGHCYFSLKDADSQIRCCLWSSVVPRLSFKPENGNRVIGRGKVEFYRPRGELSFIVESLTFDGAGAAYEAFLRLKERLLGEGLLAAERKRPLPVMPRCIGVITSRTGAVAHDIFTVLHRRWPLASVVLIPATVQGVNAADDLLRALSQAAQLPELDVLIMARGGGSAEDLWCFNDEALARAAAAFPCPVISAVGHETDFTILDFVADMRAATPSVAAEMVAPDLQEVRNILQDCRLRALTATRRQVQQGRQRLSSLRTRPGLAHPGQSLNRLRSQVVQLRTQIQGQLTGHVKIARTSVRGLRAQLHALDPQRVLERGYVLANDAATGALVTSVVGLQPQQELRLTMSDGSVQVQVQP